MGLPRSRCVLVVVWLFSALFVAGCGSSGGGDTIEMVPANVAGEWGRQAQIDRDDCGLASSLAVASSVMLISQEAGSLFVQTSGSAGEQPFSNGTGSISGENLIVHYEYLRHRRFSATAECALSVHQRDFAVVSGEQIHGSTSLTVTLSGGNCPMIGEQCEIRGAFAATRCPSPQCF